MLGGIVPVNHLHPHLLVSARFDIRVRGRRHNKFGQCGVKDQSSQPHQIPIPARATAIAAGFRFSAILDERGRVWTFGSNSFGELNRQIEGKTSPEPGLAYADEPVVQMSCGWFHLCAVTSRGRLISWGRNNYGQCGEQDKLEDIRAESVSCGSEHTVFLSTSKALGTFGWNEHGQLGRSGDSSEHIHFPHFDRRVLTAASGGSHTLALTHPRQH
mmetsp:Transcript_3128/g.9551  ORF Transcript_3128/g.9551 Transcript_3128/m.9551 type:complete len:215 (+) Transcript_3128:412-1056(+)